MEKNILQRHSDAKARIEYLRDKVAKLSRQLERLEHTNYGFVGDTVSKGRRGKKPLGTVKISGFPIPEYQKMIHQFKLHSRLLKAEEVKLLKLLNEGEQYISATEDIEMRNILSFRYIDGMSWEQTANKMNIIYGSNKYTPNGCRMKQERFFKKN